MTVESVQNRDQVQVVEGKRGVIAKAFGQFARREYWGELISAIIREALASFILSLGGTLVHYVRSRSTSDSNTIRNITGSTGTQSSAPSPSSSAFSNGYTPRTTYNPPASPSQGFPGFG